MTIHKYLEEMKSIQSNILYFLDEEHNIEENNQNLLLDLEKIGEDHQKFKLFLNLISNIANNHCNYPNFISKIEKILGLLKDYIKKYISNSELFDIFKNNKRILLFLINEKLYTVDQNFVDTLLNRQYENCNYLQYFEPEIAPFINDEWLDKCYNLDYNFWTKKIDDRDKCINNEKIDQNDTEKLIYDGKELTFDDFDDDNIHKPTNPINIQNYIDDDDEKKVNESPTKIQNYTEEEEEKSEKKIYYTDDDDDDEKVNESTTKLQNYTEEEEEEKSEKKIYYTDDDDDEKIKFLKIDQNDTEKEGEEEEEKFIELRKIGQNDSPICKLIREDNIKEFIIYINKNGINLNSDIRKSIYETNPFLLSQYYTNLIQYTAFFGSIQIFKYLRQNGVEIKPSIWLYAIHGKNSEIIHIIEDEKISPNDESYIECLKESIKCHHNDIANYILNFYLNESDKNSYLPCCYQYYNFTFLDDDDVINHSNLQYLIEYNYFTFCEYCLQQQQQQQNDEKINESIKKSFYSFIAKNINIDLIKLLLSLPYSIIDVNELRKNVKLPYLDYQNINSKKTALYLAVENENIEIVKILLSHKDVDVNILNESNAEYTRGRSDEYFSYTDYKTKNKKRTALYLAVLKENTEIIKLLLENKRIDVNVINTSTFDTAWDKGDVYFTEYKKERTALYLAVQKRNIEIINLLLSNNNIDVNILNSIYFINDKQNDFIFNDNDSQSSDFNDEINYIWNQPKGNEKDYKHTALCLAILNQDIEIVDLLLKNINIDLNKNSQIDGNEMNALHLSVKLGYIEIVKKLISFDSININALCKYNSSDKKTALFIATELKNIEIIKVLLSSEKIDVNIINEIDIYYYQCSSKNIIRSICSKKTVLYFAVEKGYNKIVKILLSNNKIDVNIVNHITIEDKELNINKKHKIRTVLHLAVKKENIDIIKDLLDREDINRDILDEKKKKAIDYVQNDQIIQLLSK